MRISDWSSDVCSSDLGCRMHAPQPIHAANARPAMPKSIAPSTPASRRTHAPFRPRPDVELCKRGELRTERSEEHTSELQSLMRISYAVFCLKKKKTHNNKTPTYVQ